MESLRLLFFAGLGSFIGGALRYAVHLSMLQFHGFNLPWATLFVNLTGSFVIGALAANFDSWPISTKVFWIGGVLGGFTTFSAFSLELTEYAKIGNWTTLLFYALISITGGILLCCAGFYCFTKFKIFI